jgi:hypothetical protein
MPVKPASARAAFRNFPLSVASERPPRWEELSSAASALHASDARSQMSLMSAPATAMHGLQQQTPVPSRLVHHAFYFVFVPKCICKLSILFYVATVVSSRLASFTLCSHR